MKKILKFFVPALALIAMASCTKAEQVGWLTVGDQYFNNEITVPGEGAATISIPYTSYNQVWAMLYDYDSKNDIYSAHNKWAAIIGNAPASVITTKEESFTPVAEYPATEGEKHGVIKVAVSGNNSVKLDPKHNVYAAAREVFLMVTNEVLTPDGMEVWDANDDEVLQQAENDIYRVITIKQAAPVFNIQDDLKFNEFSPLAGNKQKFSVQSSYNYTELDAKKPLNIKFYEDAACKFEYPDCPFEAEFTGADGNVYDLFGNFNTADFGHKNTYNVTVVTASNNDTHAAKKAYMKVYPDRAVASQTKVFELSQAEGVFAPVQSKIALDYHATSEDVKWINSLDVANLTVVPNAEATWLTVSSINNAAGFAITATANNSDKAREAEITVSYVHHGATASFKITVTQAPSAEGK